MADRNLNLALRVSADTKEGRAALQQLQQQIKATGAQSGTAFDPFTQSVARATGGIDSLTTRLKPLHAEIGVLGKQLAGAALSFSGLGGIASVAGIATIARQIATTSKELTNFAALGNTTVEQFQRLAYASKSVGVEQDKLADILKDVQDKVGDFISTGGGELADFFEKVAPRVGVTAEQFRRLSGPEALQLYVSSLERANLTQSEMTFYLEALADDAARLLPLLRNNGKAAAELADEAARLGAVIGEDLVKQGVELDRNLQRLEDLSKGAAISIGSELIPELNRLATEFLNARRVGLGFGEALVALGFEASPGESPEAAIARVTAKLDELNKLRNDMLRFVGGDAGTSALIPGVDAEIEKQRKALEYWRLQLEEQRRNQEAQRAEAEKSTNDRLKIERDLASEIDKLEKMRAVATGQANANILKDEKTLQAERIAAARKATEDQLKGYERLRDVLRATWETAIQKAREARAEAAALMQQAQDVRQVGQDKATGRRMQGMSDEERSDLAAREARNLRDDAGTSASRAVIAAYEGDLVKAQQLAEQAAKQAERAEQFADQVTDNDFAARLIEDLSKIKEQALSAQARAKLQDEQQQLDLAQGIDDQIQANENRIVDLKAELAKPINLDLDITAAEQKIAKLQAELAKLSGGTPTSGGAEAPGASEAVPTTEVQANTVEAEAAVDNFTSKLDAIPETKTVTIQAVTNPAPGSYTDPVSEWNSSVNGYATGGLIRGPGSGISDSIVARLSNGEFVIRAAAVRHYGAELLTGINNLRLPRFAEGGLVSASMGSLVEDSGSRPMVGSTFVFPGPGGGEFPVMTTKEIHAEIERLFYREALSRGARR